MTKPPEVWPERYRHALSEMESDERETWLQGYRAGMLRAAEMMRGTPGKWFEPGEEHYCRLVEHVQGHCECDERADAIVKAAQESGQEEPRPGSEEGAR